MNEEQPQKTDVPTNPIDTGDSQPINMPLELASQKQKKSKNALFIAMILLVILGVLVFAGYLVVKKANSTDSKQATTSKLEPKTPEEVIKLLKDKLKTEVDTNKNIKLKDLYQKNFYVKVAYRSSSTDFLITPAFQDRTALSYKLLTSDGKEYTTTNDTNSKTDIQKKLREYLTNSLGFSNLETITLVAPDGEEKITVYSKNSIMCSLPVDSYFISADCVTKETISQEGIALKPFVALMSKQSSANYLRYYKGTTESGFNETNGYKITQILANGVPHSFIKGSNQPNWKYAGVFNFQAPSSCSEYEKDPEIRLAFEGEECAEGSGLRKVTRP